MNRRIAVSGASGLIGTKLVTSLLAEGDSVYRLVRRKPPESASEIYWNHETSEIDSARLEGMDAVVHLAGKPLDEHRWTPAIKAAVYASRIEGTGLISRTLARLTNPPRVLVSASATDYYAESESPVGEADGRPGSGYVAEMCRDWEAATEPARTAGIRVVPIRIPSVLAAKGHSILAAFLPLFRRGLGPILGSGRQLMCFIALDDMVRAIEHIIDCETLSGPVNVLAPQVVTQREFAATLGSILHRPVILRIPGFLLRAMMGEVADAILAGDTNLKPEKLLASGFQFQFPDLTSALRHELQQTSAGADRAHPASPVRPAPAHR
ncbi:MAG TPA: TIGR01777 family oxidoreductase [Thermoanaerobaculia bacterium]